MRYGFLSYKNGLLKVILIPYNNKVLINNLIDLYDRLVKLYEHKRYSRRQKIISSLNREAKEYVLIKIRCKKEICNTERLDKVNSKAC